MKITKPLVAGALVGTAVGTVAFLIWKHCAKKPAEKGEDGIGVEKAELIGNDLYITYTNGETVNLGKVVPEPEPAYFDFYPLPDGTYGVKAGKYLYLSEVAIPSEHRGHAVTAILPNAFENAINLQRISIPDSITRIERDAFTGCNRLIYNRRGNVDYLGNDENPCLIAVKAVSKNILEASIAPGCKFIQASAFAGCRKLERVTVPSSVCRIGARAFFECDALESVSISDLSAWCHIDFEFDALDYSANPLCYADKLLLDGEPIEEIQLPKDVTSLPICALSSASLKRVVLSDSLKSIGDYAFDECTELTEIEIPASTEYVGSGVFYGCRSLECITVSPESKHYHSDGNCLIETASKTLIAGCKSSVIPTDGSVTAIGRLAFAGHNTLASVTIPNEITRIGEMAFCNCMNLEALSVPFMGSEADGDDCTHFGYLFGAENDSEHLDRVPKSLKSVKLTGKGAITSYAFADCAALEDLTVGADINAIGYHAFLGCEHLSAVRFEDPNGWRAEKVALDAVALSDPATAAAYLRSTYDNRNWTKE